MEDEILYARRPVDTTGFCFDDETELVKQVITFDPSEVYARIEEHLDPYKRTNKIPFAVMWPPNGKGTCDCGCGKKLTGRQTRWASEECQKFPAAVHGIISGHFDRVQWYAYTIWSYSCSNKNCCGTSKTIELDHTLAVQNGGGGCWLANYRPLCKKCHVKKTRLDRQKNKLQCGNP